MSIILKSDNSKLLTKLPNGMSCHYDITTCKVAVSWCVLREKIKSYN